MQTATVDGVDKSATYTGLTVSFTGANYTTTNGKGLWPASGSWSFVDSDGRSIKRDDGIEIGVDVTDSSLKLSFTWTKTTLSGGRSASVSGQHVLTFSK